MIGYGSEDNDFVFEIVFNYSQDNYSRGNDFNYVNIATSNKKLFDHNDVTTKFEYNMNISNAESKVNEINLFSSDLAKTCEFWETFLQKKPCLKSETQTKIQKSDTKLLHPDIVEK